MGVSQYSSLLGVSSLLYPSDMALYCAMYWEKLILREDRMARAKTITTKPLRKSSPEMNTILSKFGNIEKLVVVKPDMASKASR